MGKWQKRPAALDSGAGSEKPAEKHKKEAKTKPRQYRESFLVHGSTPRLWADPPRPRCFFGGQVQVQRSQLIYSETRAPKPRGSVGKREGFYNAKLSELKSGQTAMEASNAASLLAAKSKQPPSVGEALVLPAAAAALAERTTDRKAAERVPPGEQRRVLSDQSDVRCHYWTSGKLQNTSGSVGFAAGCQVTGVSGGARLPASPVTKMRRM